MSEPLTFAGNPRALAAVQRSLAGERPPHAYLFAGPARVGKRTLALWLAQALNCERTAPPPSSFLLPPSSAPCGECRACTRIAAAIHADVQTVSFDTADDGRVLTEISVDQVREVERSVALAPYEGRTRVIIIDPADAMSPSAQNAFLKTLEEPPPHAVFVLITTQDDRLLPTIVSRCRRIEFRLVSVGEIETALAAMDVDADRAALIARLSGGRIGWALEAARDPSLLDQLRERLEQARSIPEMTVAERMKLAEKLSDAFKQDRGRVLSLLDEWLSWWRDLLLVQAGAETGVANVDTLSELRETASRLTRDEATRFVRDLLAAREHLQANVQSRIALEALLLDAPLPAHAGSLSS